jgi:hypothetical protein
LSLGSLLILSRLRVLVRLPSLLKIPHSIREGDVIIVGLRGIINFKGYINEIGSMSGFDVHGATSIVLGDNWNLTDRGNSVVPTPGQPRLLCGLRFLKRLSYLSIVRDIFILLSKLIMALRHELFRELVSSVNAH